MKKRENTEQPQIKGSKPGWDLMELDVVFLVVPLVLTILIPTGILLYAFGRLSWHAGLLGMLQLAAVGLIVLCFVAGAARLLAGRRKYTRTRKLLGIAEVAIPIVFGTLSVIGSPLLTKSRLWPDATPFTYGFRDRIRSRADIPAIRSWLRTFDKSAYQEPGDRVPPDKWPESLRTLKDGVVMLEADDNGNPQVRIIWGGGFFHWGVTIGLEDMEIPPSKLNDGYESWLLVEPGFYVWDF